MARTQANPKQQQREVVLTRSYWAKRQLDLFTSAPHGATARSSSLAPYASHLAQMRAERGARA